jgi:hypothetical protein
MRHSCALSLMGTALSSCFSFLISPSSSDEGGVNARLSPELGWLTPGLRSGALTEALCSRSCLSCASWASCLVFGGWAAGGGSTPCSISMPSNRAIRFDRDDM